MIGELKLMVYIRLFATLYQSLCRAQLTKKASARYLTFSLAGMVSSAFADLGENGKFDEMVFEIIKSPLSSWLFPSGIL